MASYRYNKWSDKDEKDFDIGEFVRCYDALKAHFDDICVILQKTNSIRRWEVPSVTLLCCVFVTTVCISFPELLFTFLLFPIPLIILVTGMKNASQSKTKQTRNIFVTAVENEEQKMAKKREAIARATKDLRRFIKIMRELQVLLRESRRGVDFVQSLFSWDDPQLTLRFIGFTFLIMVLLIWVPFSLIFLMIFLLLLFYNNDFKSVLRDYLILLKVRDPENVPSSKKQDEWVQTIPTEFDAFEHDNDEESDRAGSSFEDEESSGSEFEEISPDLTTHSVIQSAPERRSTSLVSNITKYRKLRKQLNKGNCVACNVAFSSLLTRRRYCRRCGNKFCSKCCRQYVRKAVLGATAPGSRDQRVLICNDCYARLRVTKAPD